MSPATRNIARSARCYGTASARTRSIQPPAFLLYVDQGEELYVRHRSSERRRFSEILAQALSDPRLRIMMSMRADFFGEL